MTKIKQEIYTYLKQYKELYGNDIFIGYDEFSLFTSLNKIDYTKKNKLNKFENEISLCDKCDIAVNRNNFVFGAGDPEADLFLVGEASTHQEEIHGIPFVGKIGSLLDNILFAINKSRKKGVYIANILKCKLPKNRDPLSKEIQNCVPYLKKQINIISPKLIVVMGKVAAKALLDIETGFNEMRNITYEYCGYPLRVTYHPAALLRNSDLKKPAWDDFKWVMNYLNK